MLPKLKKKIEVTYKPENVKGYFTVTGKNDGFNEINVAQYRLSGEHGFTTEELRKLSAFLLQVADEIESDTDLTPVK